MERKRKWRKIKKKKARGGVIESLVGNLVGCDGGGRKWSRKKRVKGGEGEDSLPKNLV